MKIDLIKSLQLQRTTRVKQLEAMFDVPAAEKCELRWSGDFDYDAHPWNVGLIVGPSGSGKTSVAREAFGDVFQPELTWQAGSVIDDFSKSLGIEAITQTCSAVGFNTIPAWMRPYAVLSNGEKFRADLARRLAELPDPIVVDEFTSVVDRQVAKIGAHAVQKWARKHGRKFVAVTCHYDVIDWLQPDWILEPATMAFTPRRSLQRRPSIDCSIQRVPYEAWKLFAPFHYLTAALHKGARCFGLFVGDRITTFGGMLYRPIGRWEHGQSEIMGLSRLVTLPDWQGLGLAMILSEKLGAMYAALGFRMHTYPAHPALVRSFDKSSMWKLIKKPGVFSRVGSDTSTCKMGGRPCATFAYCGPAMEAEQAKGLAG